MIDLSRIPFDDREVFAEIQRADTVGAFQIESRAQMQSLLRTKPENLDDLTVQVALVRPGPIQGKAVHPYIDAREKLRADPGYVWPVDHELLREPLRSTFGVVVFQDQVLEVAIALAGFTVGEAEGLRRAMSRKRSLEALEAYRERFVRGAGEKGVDVGGRGHRLRQARRLLGLRVPEGARGRVRAARVPVAVAPAAPPGRVPVRAPERAADGLLPARDARPRRAAARGGGARAGRQRQRARRARSSPSTGVRLKPDPGVSCGSNRDLLRHLVGTDEAEALVAERETKGQFRDIGDLARRVQLSRDGLEALVKGGACDGFGRKRRDLLWELGLAHRAQSVPGTNGEAKQLPLSLDPTAVTPELRDLTRWERMLADYRHTGLSVGTHPLALLRPHLPPGTLSSEELRDRAHRSTVAVAGMAIARQRPSTAKGIVFMLLEDELGQVNLIVPPDVYERHRATVRSEPLVLARGRYEKIGENRNVLVSELESLGRLAREVAESDAVWESLPRAHHFGSR